MASGLASRCEIQLAYAIGVADPVSIYVNTFGTGKRRDDDVAALVRRTFDLTPAGLIEMLDLAKPQYERTAAYGHFGRENEGFAWEKADKAEELAGATVTATSQKGKIA